MPNRLSKAMCEAIREAGDRVSNLPDGAGRTNDRALVAAILYDKAKAGVMDAIKLIVQAETVASASSSSEVHPDMARESIEAGLKSILNN